MGPIRIRTERVNEEIDIQYTFKEERCFHANCKSIVAMVFELLHCNTCSIVEMMMSVLQETRGLTKEIYFL